MNKSGWLITILIVAVNVAAVLMQWSLLPEMLPSHFDLQGNASGSIARSMLLLYPVVSAIVCMIAYLIAWKKPKLQTGLIILSSGISLVILSSALVTLTSGSMPIFMLAEPVILLSAIAGFVICVLKSRRSA